MYAGRARTATFATGSAGMKYRGIHGTSATVTSDTVTSDSDNEVTVTVPAGSAVVYKAAGKPAGPATKPTITLKAPDARATGTVELSADVDGGRFTVVPST